MSSQASWQTGASGQGGADWSEDFPDQQSVEGLLRRLVQQVEDTERRYGERAHCIEMARQKAVDLVAAGYLLEEDEAAAIHEIEAHLPEDYR